LQGLGCPLIDVTLIIDEMAPISCHTISFLVRYWKNDMFPGSLGLASDPCDQVHSFYYTAVRWRNLLQELGCPLIDVTLIIDEMAPISCHTITFLVGYWKNDTFPGSLGLASDPCDQVHPSFTLQFLGEIYCKDWDARL
jgi:hypothetical protein